MKSALENPDSGLTPKQEDAIVRLINEPNIAKVAEACEVTDRTVYRWLQEPAFSAAYRKARRDAFSQAIALTQRYAPMAVNVLAKVMADQDAPHHARVTAAVNLLRFGREAIELDDLAARVEALEQAASTKHN